MEVLNVAEMGAPSACGHRRQGVPAEGNRNSGPAWQQWHNAAERDGSCELNVSAMPMTCCVRWNNLGDDEGTMNQCTRTVT